MADEKDTAAAEKKDAPAPRRSGGQGAGAAETVQSQTAADTKSTDQKDVSAAPQEGGGQNRSPLSGAERDLGIRSGSRTGGTTEAMAAEFEKYGVDARLDNRIGDQRPRLAPYLKPQQFDGPEIGRFGEHADALGDAFAEATGAPDGEVLGSRSLGQLGRGEDPERDEAGIVEPNPK